MTMFVKIKYEFDGVKYNFPSRLAVYFIRLDAVF